MPSRTSVSSPTERCVHKMREWWLCVLINWRTNSVGKSPSSEANYHSTIQEIPRLLWNPKVHYHVHNSLPPVPILNQMHTVHTFTSYFAKILSNIIFLPIYKSSIRSYTFRFFAINILYTFLISLVHATCSAHLMFLDLITLIILGEVIYKLYLLFCVNMNLGFQCKGREVSWTFLCYNILSKL
jgi:hypothetical protein